MADRKYVRVYYDDLATEFPAVYADPALVGTWLQLLVIAERMWPAVPELPRSVKARPLARLVESELVTLCPPHSFRIRGLDAERTRRRDSARNAAALGWHSRRNADAYADAMPRRDEPRRDESTPPPPVGKRKSGTNPRALGINPRANGTSPRQEREAQKRGTIPESVHAILRRAAAVGSSDQ